MFNPGDRVTFRRAYRSRGVGTKPGGWSWDNRTGTVTYATNKSVWIKMDTPQWMDIVERVPADRVQLITPPGVPIPTYNGVS